MESRLISLPVIRLSLSTGNVHGSGRLKGTEYAEDERNDRMPASQPGQVEMRLLIVESDEVIS